MPATESCTAPGSGSGTSIEPTGHGGRATDAPVPGLPGSITPRWGAGGQWRVPAGADADRIAAAGLTSWPRVGGSVNLTVPLTTLLGLAGVPGYLDGFGPVTAATARQMASTAVGGDLVRWCVTVTDEDGRAVGHGCVTRRQVQRARSPSPSPGHVNPTGPGGWQMIVNVSPLALRDCSHEHESAKYELTPSLRHLIEIRDRTCVFPGCRRAATACDKDHTVPYGKGGRTCWCNLAPLCRTHHRVKQACGWGLAQPHPGILIWTAPSGWTYRVITGRG
jgi:hypothetical protein